ncbi:TPA: oxaloacetate-decarboxylating malate dehydrogenase [Klebsiella variicola subsp. variicola]
MYDPTVADACLNFGHIYRRARGLYLTRDMKDRFAEVLKNWPVRNVRFICVSTGGRILGLGDIGANGMGIPIGKLQLYTACAAVPPQYLLPILLDIGTTNESLRADPLYLGSKSEPPSYEEVDAIAEAFILAANEVFPGVCIHFEDWKGTDAMRLLERYRDRILCYNDDIQGTASIVVAALTTALQIKHEKFSDQRILFLGAGSAGIGIANMLVSAMQMEGLSEENSRSHIHLADINGLIESSRQDLNKWQKIYAHDTSPERDLLNMIRTIKPTILIGVSTTGGAFTESIVKEMALLNERSVIFSLSNPTNRAECSAEQVYKWTNGQALFAAGVQFPNVRFGSKTFYPAQANNFLMFPAIGLAIFATKPKRITDEMFIRAAETVANQVSHTERECGMLLPSTGNILEMEITTAVHVAEYIFDNGKASVERPDNIRTWIESLLYHPTYASLPF